MNLHPIVVHFPIALLVVYVALEVFSLVKPSRAQRLETTKLICLWVGTIGSFLALQSGEVAQDLLGKSELIHTHEEFAEKSHAIFSTLSVIYVVKMVYLNKIGARYRNKVLAPYEHKILRVLHSAWLSWSIAVVAVVGFVVISIVGALGGAISHGTNNNDPVVDLAVKLFVK